MPATRAKYEDMQEINVTIGENEFVENVVVTHNLSKQHDDSIGYDYVDPDMVYVEIMNTNDPLNPIQHLYTSRPSSPDGTVTVGIGSHESSETPRTCRIRVNCAWWHSIEGSDHSVSA